MSDHQELLTVRETADILRVSESKVRTMFKDGVLSGTKLSERNIRIFPDSVNALISDGDAA